MKDQTLAALLDGIAAGCDSKRQLQTRTGFSWGSVSSYISLLEERGAIEAVPPDFADAEDSRSVRYRITTASNLCLGMELRSASIDAVLGTFDGRTLARRTIPAEARLDNRNLGNTIREAFTTVLAAAGTIPAAVGGLVFAVTGAADLRENRWLRSPHNPGIRDFDFEPFRALLPAGGLLAVEHDILSKARSVLEDLGNPPGDNLFLHVGDGIGMALEQNHIFFTGSRGFAGEIGHIPFHPTGGREGGRRRCSCGQSDCLEAFLPEPGAAEADGQLEPLLFQLCVTAVNLCDPDRLILGGEAVETYLEKHGEPFAQQLRERCWIGAPAEFRTYRMAECVPALGAVLGQRKPLIHAIVSALE